MAIDFFNLLDDDGWVPVERFVGSMWTSTKIDPAFNLVGVRMRADFTVPTRHLNLRQLTIVFGGELTVTSADDGDADTDAGDTMSTRVGPGEFWITPAGTPFSVTAGPDGATFVECWPEPVAGLQTDWHDDGRTITE
ncbi:MAG: hypothetical protein JWL72_534 [Ilumatobacteraceae bacterium]|nr:hypothetical protein [Ilumatobacteraceae bacterium]